MTGLGNDRPDLDDPLDDPAEIAHGIVILVATTPPQQHPLDPQYDLQYRSRRHELQPTLSVRVNDQMRDVDIRPALTPKRQLLDVLVRMNALEQQADVERPHSCLTRRR